MPEDEVSDDMTSVDNIREFFKCKRPDLLIKSRKYDEKGIPDFPIQEAQVVTSRDTQKALRKPSVDGTSGIFPGPPSNVGKRSLGAFTTTSVKTASSCKMLALEAVESLFDQLETVKSEQFDAHARIQDANKQRDEAILERDEAIEQRKQLEKEVMAVNYRVQELLTSLCAMQKENYLFESALREAISGLGKANEKIRILKDDHRKVCDELLSEK